jgi:nucleoside-diphosphate-sugar epimerase
VEQSINRLRVVIDTNVESVKIFIAGGTGAIGRVLVPMLVTEGHHVIALTRSEALTSQLANMGAVPVVGDVYDEVRLAQLVADSKAEVVIHQLTAFGTTDGDPYAETIRVRIEGTRNLIAAVRAAQVPRFVAQSISFMCSPFGSGLTDEETPLYLDATPPIRDLADAIASLEEQTLHARGVSGLVLRYGWFYGPGTSYDLDGTIPRAIRAGTMPIVGDGAGTYSFINLRDAADATLKALDREASGIYNIVDDAPVRLSEWLPIAANLLEAPAPGRVGAASAREQFGAMRVYYMNEQRGASNAKAKRELGWQPAFASWQTGFEALYWNTQ